MKSIKTKIWGLFGDEVPIAVNIDDDGNGIVDGQAQRAFRNGQCHALALEIHKATNWPIIGVFAEDDVNTPYPESPSHCVVYDESIDAFVDIRGEFNPFGLPWSVARLAEMDPKDIPKLAGYIKADLKAAKPFVRTVVGPLEKLPRKTDNLVNKFKYIPLSITKIAQQEGLTSLLA
jgi:hypothetical protein